MRRTIHTWLNDRFDLAGFLRAVRAHLRKPVPPHVNFLFTLGSLALLLFLLQAVTGLLLMVYYKPTVRDAHASIRFISEDVPLGWLIRQLHTWGAHLILLLAALHAVKTYAYGGYKRPRELTWMIGVLIFGTLLGFGFTGTLLPWNQLAFWATTVGTEAPGSLPLIGPHITALLRGGPHVGDATLGRFFVAHVALLPAALIVLVALHLLLVRLLGISPLTRADTPEPDAETLARAGGKPFVPHHLLKEAIAAYLLLGLLLTLAILAPFDPGDPADPFETPPGIKPDWFFLPAFQLLKYLPEPLAVALPAVAGVLFLLLPLLDRSPERHPRNRPLAIRLGIGFLILILALGVLGALSETTRTVFGKTIRFDARGLPLEIVDTEEELP